MSYLTSDIITRVQEKLDDPSFDTPRLLNFMNDTEREIFNRYRINTEEQDVTTLTTTQGVRTITGLPAAGVVGQFINMRIILPINYARVVPYVEYEDADVYYPNYQLIGQGPPIAWFIFEGVPSLLNNADKTYTLGMKYTLLPTKITSTSQTPNLPEEFSEITVLGMYARALEFNDVYDEATAIRQQYHQLAVDYVDATRRVAGVVHKMRKPNDLRRNFGQV